MRLKPIIFFLVVGSLAGYFVYREATRVGSPGTINVGEMAPDFTIKDEQGREVKLSDYRGKLVFLNFWTTWCAPCVEEMPEMETLYNTFKNKNFHMLAVSLDTNCGVVKKFYEQYNLTLPTVLDPGRQVATAFKIRGQPETFLIDEKGVVLKHYVGPERWTSPRVLALIEQMIPASQQTSARN